MLYKYTPFHVAFPLPTSFRCKVMVLDAESSVGSRDFYLVRVELNMIIRVKYQIKLRELENIEWIKRTDRS